ncbi:MAG TPA: hypothetical protein VF530_23340 [Planctomycetota bacterium]
MDRMSNRERIARAAEEARLAEAEKAEKAARKTGGEAPKRRAKALPKAPRVKIVWEVCNSNGKTLETYAYPDKAKAQAEAAALTKSTGRPHSLRASKVPME